MQKARCRAFPLRGIALQLLANIRFQVYFTPLTGVLFTFPSRYWFTIGRQLVFSLGGWSLRIPTGFHVSRGTREPVKGVFILLFTGLSPSMAGLSRPFN